MRCSGRVRQPWLTSLGLIMVISTLVLTGGSSGEERGPEGADVEDDDVVVTSRRSNYVREGPGSFHEVLVAVKEETPLVVLQRSEGWIRVRLPDDRTGWISETSVRTGDRGTEVTMGDIAEEWAAPDATPSGVAAAVRGFQMHADGLDEGAVDELMAYLRSTPSITEDDIDHFRAPLESGRHADLDLGDLQIQLAPYDPNVQERQVGMAVATRLSSKGLVRSPRVQRYLALLTEHLTANTPYYDQSFDVLIIEGEGPDAFACPGGLIFLTRGVFTHFETEAQLSALLAHELAHIVRRHGMIERGEREVQRKADAAFAELEEATQNDDDKYERVEEDLASLMRQSYERVVNDRLLEYEKDADRIAAALLAEAGYAPNGIVEAVQHIASLRTHDPDLFDEDYLEARNLQNRLQEIESFLDPSDAVRGQRLPRRFQAYKQELQ